MTKTKTRRLGDRAFEIEWCYEIPIDPETGNADMENLKLRRRIAATIDEALAVAKEVFPLDKWGAVTVTEIEWIDPYEEGRPATYRWDYVAPSRHYSGDADGNFDD